MGCGASTSNRLDATAGPVRPSSAPTPVAENATAAAPPLTTSLSAPNDSWPEGEKRPSTPTKLNIEGPGNVQQGPGLGSPRSLDPYISDKPLRGGNLAKVILDTTCTSSSAPEDAASTPAPGTSTASTPAAWNTTDPGIPGEQQHTVKLLGPKATSHDPGPMRGGTAPTAWGMAPDLSEGSSQSSLARHRYGTAGSDELLAGFDDDDDHEDYLGTRGFSLERWRRFYKWNKRKTQDLLTCLWKTFDPSAFSLYCVSYRPQDLFFAGYQGENLLHGLASRYEDSGVDMFGIMHVLHDYNKDQYKVVGVFIFPGQEVPAKLTEMPDYPDYAFAKADPKDPTVRQFVSSLMSGVSPALQYSVIVTREVLTAT